MCNWHCLYVFHACIEEHVTTQVLYYAAPGYYVTGGPEACNLKLTLALSQTYSCNLLFQHIVIWGQIKAPYKMHSSKINRNPLKQYLSSLNVLEVYMHHHLTGKNRSRSWTPTKQIVICFIAKAPPSLVSLDCLILTVCSIFFSWVCWEVDSLGLNLASVLFWRASSSVRGKMKGGDLAWLYTVQCTVGEPSTSATLSERSVSQPEWCWKRQRWQ